MPKYDKNDIEQLQNLLNFKVDFLKQFPEKMEEIILKVCRNSRLNSLQLDAIVTTALKGQPCDARQKRYLMQDLNEINEIANMSARDLKLKASYDKNPLADFVKDVTIAMCFPEKEALEEIERPCCALR